MSFVSVCPWCICNVIASNFIFYPFSDSMRNEMVCFKGKTLSHIIYNSFHRLGSSYTICCLSPRALHNSWILIGLQLPPEKYFTPIHITKTLSRNSSCGPDTTIDGPGPSREYSGWKKIVDALGLMNLPMMDPLAFPRYLYTVADNNISKLSMINASGGFIYQLLTAPRESFCGIGVA